MCNSGHAANELGELILLQQLRLLTDVAVELHHPTLDRLEIFECLFADHRSATKLVLKHPNQRLLLIVQLVPQSHLPFDDFRLPCKHLGIKLLQ